MDKESWRRGGDSQPAPRGESSFDELAKNLADGSISRRKALRFIGGAFVGGLLASIPGTAWAAKPPPPGKGGCPPGRVQCRGKCVDLKSDRNNCGQCANVCSEQEFCCGGRCCSSSRGEQCCDFGGGSQVCCPPDTYCAGPELCCRFNETVCGGQCVSTDCPGPFNPNTCQCCQSGEQVCQESGQCVSAACPEGQFFNPVTCQCEVAACGNFGGPCPTNPCGPPENPDSCGCVLTAEGSTFCLQHGSCGQPCASTAECPAGTACVETCCGFACQFPCGAAPLAAPDVNASGGRTTNGR
jgi:hypothetical protein